VRRLEGPAKAGLHRLNWDLRGPSPEPIDLTPPAFQPPWAEPSKGPLVAPGRYTATLMLASSSGVRALGTPQSFDVKPVGGTTSGTEADAVATFQTQVAELRRQTAALEEAIGNVRDDLRRMRAALVAAPRADAALMRQLDEVNATLAGVSRRLSGDPARGRLNEPAAPSVGGRVYSAMSALDTTQMPTSTQRRDAEIAQAELTALSKEFDSLIGGELAKLETALEAAGAPWTPRRRLPR
jgi:hypothetical protein